MNNTHYKNIRKVLQMGAYYLLPIFLAISLLVVEGRELKHFAKELGSISVALFIFIMFIKPVSVFLPKITLLKKIVLWRKELGIAIFYLAFFHMIGIFISSDLFSYPEEWLYGLEDPAVLFGTVSMIGMVFLGLTSNKFSIKKLKKNWQKLHYLAYPTLFFALLHKFGLEKGTYIPAFILFGIFCILKFFEWKKSGKILKSKNK